MMSWWIALQFLSSLPVRLRRMPMPAETGRSLLWYPAVGLLFAALLASVDSMLAGAPLLLHAAILLAVWIFLTGGLHLDGFADTTDAWVGGYGDRERTLAIMKDPRSGPMAVVALIVLLLLKFTALAAVLQAAPGDHWWIVPVLGRAALLGVFLTTPYVRAGGLGEALANDLPRTAGWVVLAGCLLAGWLSLGSVLLAGIAAFAWLRWLLLRRLGGTTGDTAGAMLECLEVVLLVGLAL
ncbi:adenosylcobinamide-GDP ribazoletransferase [Pseudomonas japonica]|uniref:adenosylcobinamide-GDP ribazoletransferase n=1 Tax=Pseudomonas japonica TaxID=256466 RepID=UPI0015E296A7|nr:adenosylcobinamide-GDP ribazoletransferase [Pseudomonas japonica]MBA1242710.1 adenosylcobinamide-GDP ribazoletransferase [Pseudomonas japonica]